MTTINDAYINALLADAAYVDGLAPGLTGANLASLTSGRMTPDLAKFIGDNFTVVTQESGLASSFEAVVWRGNANTPFAGQVYVSMRGTQGGTDILADGDLASTGLAHGQLADMVNWWLRETIPTLTDVGTPRYATQVMVTPSSDFGLAAPVLGTGRLVDVITIKSINGHSLGGYLATSFTRFFGGKWPIQAVNTFNSAGFSRPATSNIDQGFSQIAQLIGASIGLPAFSNAQDNYFALNGINVTTNTWNPVGFRQYGMRIGLYQEDLTPQGINNHYMYKLTDLLALGNAIERLDPTFDVSRLSALVSASGNEMISSYESLLDGLRRSLVDRNATSTLTGDANADNSGPQPDSRLDFHRNLTTLQHSDAFTSLAGKVSVISVNRDLGQQAKARVDFQTIVALETLSPFVVNPIGSGGQIALDALWRSSAWSAVYQDWLSDKASLSAGGQANRYTDQYLTDRAAMLDALALRNQQNLQDEVAAGTGRKPVQYQDVRSGIQFQIGLNNPLDDKPLIRFGGDAPDTLDGKSKTDHLYGGAGTDTLNGLGGADWLEGNADNDTLDGGAGDEVSPGTLVHKSPANESNWRVSA